MKIIDCPGCGFPPRFRILKEGDGLYCTVECVNCGVSRGHFRLIKPLSMSTHPEHIRDLCMKRRKAYILWNKTFEDTEDNE